LTLHSQLWFSVLAPKTTNMILLAVPDHWLTQKQTASIPCVLCEDMNASQSVLVVIVEGGAALSNKSV